MEGSLAGLLYYGVNIYGGGILLCRQSGTVIN